MQLLITVSAPAGATSAPARTVATDIVDRLAQSPHVANVTSAWTAPPAAAAGADQQGRQLRSDRRGNHRRREQRPEVRPGAVRRSCPRPSTASLSARAGWRWSTRKSTTQTERDLLLMESIAIPLSFLVLVWVFGGLLAAAVPMAVGPPGDRRARWRCCALITFGTDVSIFALNLTYRAGPGAGDRLHAVDHQSLPRRARRRCRSRRGADPHHGHGRTHGVVLRDDCRAVDGARWCCSRCTS